MPLKRVKKTDFEPEQSLTNGAVADPRNGFRIHKGECTVDCGGKLYVGEATLDFEIKHYPNVAITFIPNEPIPEDDENITGSECLVKFDQIRAKARCYFGALHFSAFGGFDQADGTIVSMEMKGEIEGVAKIRGYLFNFPETKNVGDGSLVMGSSHIYTGRTELSFEKWKITIDSYEDMVRRRASARLNRGFAPTHVFQIERRDGKLIKIPDAEKFVECLKQYLAFVSGGRSLGGLLFGYRREADPKWISWKQEEMDHGTLRSSWAGDSISSDIFSSIEVFANVWKAESDRPWLVMAVNLYVHSCRRGSGPDVGLISAQSGLELVAYVVLVKKAKVLSANGFKKLEAEEKIRLLLHFANVTFEIPAYLHGLKETFHGKDGPHAVSSIRNDLVHPGDPIGSSFHKVDKEAREDAYTLALYYFEASLLYALNYKGKMCNRSVGHYLEASVNVPWDREGL